MREIKFRGRDVETGELVFGSLVEYEGGKYRFWINPLEGDRNYPVEPDTVAQLIGVDKNGREIFEGDKITANGYPYTVIYKSLNWEMIPDNPAMLDLMLLWHVNYEIEVVGRAND